ncbi:MAG: YigZ family protein [Rhodanobacter sp.]|nr:MAG: YigZ family protein [Rhodanobacter sp.]TAM11707.1 MAG: YigZ family protein [Rhodanobacter sp.]TAM36110.1 MAG: YigZ family protein [Rhodanobacter sp.]
MSTMLFTLRRAYEWQAEIRKSRFRALATPVASAEAALDWLRTATAADASHNCWAYRVGSAYRFHDDGEPGGSAGRPILAAIDGQACDRVAVLVTRWYGGIKLGVGGLARAYGGTAAECLRRAERTPIVVMAHLRIRCRLGDLALIEARLRAANGVVTARQFGADDATLDLVLPQPDVDEVLQRVTNLTRGQVGVQRMD